MLNDDAPPSPATAGRWSRRRSPRLSGTLHILESTGHELVVPLRGRAVLLTAGGTGLRGHGEVWAVRTDHGPTSLMIVYWRTHSVEDRQSGLCVPGATVVLSGAGFTWRAHPAPRIPQPRTAATGVPRNLRTPPARGTNTRTEPVHTEGLRGRLRNMVHIVTQTPRG